MVGSTRSRKVDVRIMAATNKDLQGLAMKGTFREDLFFRLNVIAIAVPPLRERGDDILMLAQHFANRYAREFNKPTPRFTDSALKTLKQYDWPGNVRELKSILKKACILARSESVGLADLPPEVTAGGPRHESCCGDDAGEVETPPGLSQGGDAAAGG